MTSLARHNEKNIPMPNENDRQQIRKRVEELLLEFPHQVGHIESILREEYTGKHLVYATRYLEVQCRERKDVRDEAETTKLLREGDFKDFRIKSDDRLDFFNEMEEVPVKHNSARFYKGKSNTGIIAFVKFLRQSYAVTQAQQIARALNEYRRFNVFRDKNVVMVYSVGMAVDRKDNEFPFVAMEYLEGHNLQKWREERVSQKSPPTLREACEIVRVVAATLQRMLDSPPALIENAFGKSVDSQLLHLDVKPENIMVVRQQDGSVRDATESTIKIVDFGSAGTAETASAIGTEGYLAPERLSFIEFRPKPNPQWDIYSLGGVLYYLITGKNPVAADGMFQTDWTSWFKEIDLGHSDVTLICKRCLTYEPSQRYVTPGQLAEDLDAWVTDKPLPHVRKGDYSLWETLELLWKRCKQPGKIDDGDAGKAICVAYLLIWFASFFFITLTVILLAFNFGMAAVSVTGTVDAVIAASIFGWFGFKVKWQHSAITQALAISLFYLTSYTILRLWPSVIGSMIDIPPAWTRSIPSMQALLTAFTTGAMTMALSVRSWKLPVITLYVIAFMSPFWTLQPGFTRIHDMALQFGTQSIAILYIASWFWVWQVPSANPNVSLSK